MKPLEFLAAVLPFPTDDTLYCVAELSTARKEHAFVASPGDFVPHIKRWLKSQRDIYFALSCYTDEVHQMTRRRRTTENTRVIRALFIDMDGYDSKKEAAEALNAFMEKTGIDAFGTPYVVDSGGGLHVYWPLTENASVADWYPVAENLKRLCKQEGMAIDNTVTADAARVLRVPGTFNFKKKYGEPRAVKLRIAGDALVDLRSFSAHIRGQLRAEYAPISNDFLPTGLDIAGARPTKANKQRTAVSEALLGSSTTRFEPIWIKSTNGEGCAQLQNYIDNAEEDGLEPVWRGLLSWAKVCTDADEYTAKLSALHPYPRERMVKKLSEIRGPYPCAKMDSENPGVCTRCPHWGRVTNGLALGREFKTNEQEKVYQIPLHISAPEQQAEPRDDDAEEMDADAVEQRDTAVRTAKRTTPPKGFSYGERGGVFVEVREKDATGVVITTQVMVLPYDLFVVDLLRVGDNEHHAHLMAVRPLEVGDDVEYQFTPVMIPTKSLVSKDELLKCLAAHNIYAANGSFADPLLYRYVRACVEEAALRAKAIEVPIQMGWQRDRSFVYNNRVFRPDGTETAVPMPGLENINRATNSRGTIEGWRKPWDMLVAKKMHTMLAMCADAFGSTLMTMSEYEGFVWHIGSTGSGTGKSLTLSLKAGVWGHPVRYRTGKGTSPVAMQQRAGLLNSMPLLVDEITAKTRGDAEWAPAFIFDISEGQGKERMEAGANRERVNNSTWALTCTLTSNTHMIDILTGARKHSSAGELMRMLEWTPTKELTFSETERLTLKELRRNYGVAGEAWIRWLVTNYALAKDLWGKVHAKLRGELKFSDEERYWHAACTSTVAAAIMLGPKYANLVQLPVGGIVEALGELVENARAQHKRTARSAEDVLNAYIREFYGRFVVVRADQQGKLLAELGKELLGQTSSRHTVLGRIEHGVGHQEGWVDFWVEETLLRQHCASLSFGYADFSREISKLRHEGYRVQFGVRKDLLAKTDGPPMRVSCMYLSCPKAKVDEASGEVPLVAG